MPSVPSLIARMLPPLVRERVRPSWYRTRLLFDYYRRGGRLAYDREVGAWVARKGLPSCKPIRVVVRSQREFARFARFGSDPQDSVHRWLDGWADCRVFWDIGSANGLEGFFMQAKHGASVVFVEPFAPSVETLLKTIYMLSKEADRPDCFEVVQGLCDERSGLGKVVLHGVPKAGETQNAAAAGLGEYYYTRNASGRLTQQWLAQVSLDDLRYVHGLAPPTHVKIDVDGYEIHVLRGAQQLIESRDVRAFIVEVNGENGDGVGEIFSRQGYVKADVYDHGRKPPYTAQDHLFLRNDLATPQV